MTTRRSLLAAIAAFFGVGKADTSSAPASDLSEYTVHIEPGPAYSMFDNCTECGIETPIRYMVGYGRKLCQRCWEGRPPKWNGPEPVYLPTTGVYLCHVSDGEQLRALIDKGRLPLPGIISKGDYNGPDRWLNDFGNIPVSKMWAHR